MKRTVLSLLLLAAVLLTSCRSGELGKMLGFGAPDYSGEPVTGTVEPDSDAGLEITEMIKMLSVDSVKLPEFTSMKESVNLCRDSLLNYMLYTDFAKYSGDPALLEDAEKAYPDMTISQLIPASDFESMMYRYFGGNVKISHVSGRMFRYLPKASAYVPLATPRGDRFDVILDKVEETENTYRVEFTCSNGEKSLSYRAVIIKRDDGTMYFSSVKRK